MFKFSGFTQKANTVINLAISQASVLGHTYVGSEHLLLGLLKEGSGVAFVVLNQKGIRYDDLKELLIKAIGKGVQTTLTPNDFTPRCRKILELSVTEARVLGHGTVGTEHILMALLKEEESYANRFLYEIGFDNELLYRSLMETLGAEIGDFYGGKKTVQKTNRIMPKTPLLDKFGKDLTEAARCGKLDPVIGREKEIDRVIQILSRRSKNNPCLIGEAGVGKTAVAEGLAQIIARGTVPDSLQEKRVVSLDLTCMVAGTKYRGEFEERVKNTLEEVVAAGNILLFIDEIHNIIGIGAAEGAIDAANILKPQLARGEIQLIGATTFEEYRKFIEKDSALERRFQSVVVEEPSQETTVRILKGLKEKYEEHHRIEITEEALVAAVKLSVRYLPDRFLPDKAIDLIDEAASKVRLRTFGTPYDLAGLESRLKNFQQEKEFAVRSQDFELAAEIRDREREIRSKMEELRQLNQEKNNAKGRVTREDVARIVSDTTGIDVTSLTQEQSERLLKLEDVLHQRIVGQEEAVHAVSRAVRRGRVGLKDPKRPVGSFIFLGPTGVGKTELCKALAQCLFSDEHAIIKLDMSEYMEKHTVSRLVGSPPGYVGYEEGGQLTEKIRRKPYSILLFDEIEKAHPDVFNMLLQILDEGVLTDSQGRQVSFKNTVIIMTSNVGARHLTDTRNLGFQESGRQEQDQQKQVKGEILKELKALFRPEFLNRVDEIIVFQKLTLEEVKQISLKMLEQLEQRLRNLHIKIDFTPQAVDHITLQGYDPLYGARPLRRMIQTKVEDNIAEQILEKKIQVNDSIICDVVEKELIFTKV